MVSPETTGYLGVDTREYPAAAELDDQVVLAFSHEHYGRLRFPLEESEIEQVRDDIDSALERLEAVDDS